MARRIDVEKKRPARWPWLAGLVVLGLLAWGVTILLAPPDQPAPPEAGPTPSDTLPPAAIPAPPRGGTAWATARATDMATLAPLGDEDVGDTVRARGEVVATGNGAFWISVGTEIIRVDSRRPVRKGDTVAVHGLLATSDDETTGRIESEVLGRTRRYDDFTVVREVKLVESDHPDEATPSDSAPGPPSTSG